LATLGTLMEITGTNRWRSGSRSPSSRLIRVLPPGN